jgi:hypothetical protein
MKQAQPGVVHIYSTSYLGSGDRRIIFAACLCKVSIKSYLKTTYK